MFGKILFGCLCALAAEAGGETLAWNGADGGAREIELVLPRARFGPAPLDFQFHWKDNPGTLARHPTIRGDDAPECRFNYVFRRAGGQEGQAKQPRR